MDEGTFSGNYEAADLAANDDDDLYAGSEAAVESLALSDALAKSILESEEWPSYVEKLRQVGDDDEHIEGLLRADGPSGEYPLWKGDEPILPNVDPMLSTSRMEASAELPSPYRKHAMPPLETVLRDEFEADEANNSSALQSRTEPLLTSPVSDSRHATPLTSSSSGRSSSKSVYLTSSFTALTKLNIIEENIAKPKNKLSSSSSSSSKPPGTTGVSVHRFLFGRSGSRNSETSSGAKCPLSAKNSAEWSPEIEQLRASLISSGSSGECDLLKSSFRISKSGSSIMALERLFLEAVDAVNEPEREPVFMSRPEDCRRPQLSQVARKRVPNSENESGISSERLPLQRLGRGAFGRVFGVQIKGRLVAVKDVRHVDTPSEQHASQLVHRHVVRTLCVAPLEPRRFLVVMEYGGPRTLQHLLDEKGNLGTPDVCRFGRQLASALHYCHRSNVLHLDVKPSNVLVNGGDCKLADFGSSALRGTKPKVCGTVQYMAPEVLTGQRPDFSADVYSLGVVLWQMQSGGRPFDGFHQHVVIFQVVRLRARPVFPDGDSAPAELQALVKRCWSHATDQRPSVGAVLQELTAFHKMALKSRSAPG